MQAAVSEPARFMPQESFARWILAGLLLLALAQNGFYYQHLPERTATHFDLRGEADGWMTKGQATAFMLGIQIGLPLFLVGIARATQFLPASVINIPHREYWLHPERRTASLAYVRKCVGWIAVSASIFMLLINHLVYRANMTDGRLGSVWFGVTLAVYLLFIAGFVIQLWRHFRLPAKAE